jgi:hypothetical protein
VVLAYVFATTAAPTPANLILPHLETSVNPLRKG